MSEEKIYCTDEGQGFDHKCVTFFDGLCSRESRCKYQLSEYQLNRFKKQWEFNKEQIEREIKQKIVQTLGLQVSSDSTPKES